MALTSPEMLQAVQAAIEATTVADPETTDDRFRAEFRARAVRVPGRTVVIVPGGSRRTTTFACGEEHEMAIDLFVYYPVKQLLKAVADSSAIAETLHGLPGAVVDISQVQIELGAIATTGENEIEVSRGLRVIWIRSN